MVCCFCKCKLHQLSTKQNSKIVYLKDIADGKVAHYFQKIKTDNVIIVTGVAALMSGLFRFHSLEKLPDVLGYKARFLKEVCPKDSSSRF